LVCIVVADSIGITSTTVMQLPQTTGYGEITQNNTHNAIQDHFSDTNQKLLLIIGLLAGGACVECTHLG